VRLLYSDSSGNPGMDLPRTNLACHPSSAWGQSYPHNYLPWRSFDPAAGDPVPFRSSGTSDRGIPSALHIPLEQFHYPALKGLGRWKYMRPTMPQIV